jgi:FixJ family two-component response regulator
MERKPSERFRLMRELFISWWHDIVMPRMSGPVLDEQLRGLCPTLPVLYTSGIVSAKNFEGIMGGWLLPKPYTQEVLAEKVHEVITRSA